MIFLAKQGLLNNNSEELLAFEADTQELLRLLEEGDEGEEESSNWITEFKKMRKQFFNQRAMSLLILSCSF